MCGRFTQQQTTENLVEHFGIQHVVFAASPRYNVAPTQTIAVVVADTRKQERYLEGFTWGLVPFWAKDVTIGSKLINARAETVSEKPAFREAFRHRRCLIPADGFYEWDKAGGTRQPYHFRRPDRQLFAFAGLWDEWNGPEGAFLRTCTLITTAANATVSPYHERMPVILQTQAEENQWLDDRLRQTDTLQALLRPLPADWLEAVAVSRQVNRATQDGPELLQCVTASSTLSGYSNHILQH